MTTWSDATAPDPTMGMNRVYPIPIGQSGFAANVNFMFRVTSEFPDFYVSTSTTLAIVTDSSGLSRGTP